MNQKYDSTAETEAHIVQVQDNMRDILKNLDQRAIVHDRSKLLPPEKEMFDEVTGKLRGLTYGSEEYKQSLADLKPALDHHYAHNSHHPEHYKWRCFCCNSQFSQNQWEKAPQGPNDSGKRYCPKCSSQGLIYETQLDEDNRNGYRGMSLFDVIEMLADWYAATKRHADGDLAKSIEINAKRFGYGDDLKGILQNTARELGWIS